MTDCHTWTLDTRSNHPPSVFKAVPKEVAKRIATNSSSREVFENVKGPFVEALKEANYAVGDLKEAWDYANYPKDAPPKKKKKGRNCTYVIVPWCASVATNVIGLIKGLVDFPVGSILRKLFCNNRNYSYGVAKNMGNHIQGHNNKVLGHRGGEIVTAGYCNERPCRDSQQGIQTICRFGWDVCTALFVLTCLLILFLTMPLYQWTP